MEKRESGKSANVERGSQRRQSIRYETERERIDRGSLSDERGRSRVRSNGRDREAARFEFAKDGARPTIDVVRFLCPNFLFDERQGRVRFASAKTRRDAARRGAA